jgi:CxxC-x17-CxxC domain-containing protein
MNNDDLTIFAETTFRNKFRKFGIKTDDRRRHMYLIGKTGMGKSTILENMIVEDIRAGKGVAVVDPHGDLAEKVIKYIPSNRVNDVIYFNPSDMDYPIALNVVEHVEPHLRHLVASGLLSVFQKLWADSWGPRLEYILRNAILAVLDYPGSTLLAVTRMLSDKAFRKKVIEKIEDPVVKAFWVNEFAGYADKFASEAVSPIQNKVGQFLSSSLIRNIVGQVKSTISMREIMDNGKILILNLSKGRIGEDNSALLGSMMITKIQLAAMSRVDMPENVRKDFYLYVDEFQNFATDSFANILSEARKYRLNLIMAHQYIEQLNETVKFSVFGNVGTFIVFRVGAADAEALVPEFTPTFTEEDIVNLPKYEIYLKLMIDGIASEPFSARGLRPLREDEVTGNEEKVIKVSRERYAKDRKVVEDKINRWHSGDENAQDASVNVKKMNNASAPFANKEPQNQNTFQAPKSFTAPDNRFPAKPAFTQETRNNYPNQNQPVRPAVNNFNDSLYKFSAVCAACGQETKTSFQPDGIRPVYCRICLAKAREDKKLELEARRKAKEEELRKISAEEVTVAKQEPETTAPENKEELSLGEALSRKPVDFHGRPIAPSSPKVENKPYIPPKPIIPAKDERRTSIEPSAEKEIRKPYSPPVREERRPSSIPAPKPDAVSANRAQAEVPPRKNRTINDSPKKFDGDDLPEGEEIEF